MGFGDLKTDSGLNSLNSFLTDKSYIEGFVPSQADIAVYEALKGCPPDSLHHAARWYCHITSFLGVKGDLPGEKKNACSYGPATNGTSTTNGAASDADDSDSDVDLFGSEDEDEKKAREEAKKKLQEGAKAKKAVIGKSTIIFDVKPWDDETDMSEMERLVRSITQDGLLWGASKLVPVGYGIKKLCINCVIEDAKVSVDDLEEAITAFEDYVQSVDIAAFNKI